VVVSVRQQPSWSDGNRSFGGSEKRVPALEPPDVLSSGEFLCRWVPMASPHITWCSLALSSYSSRLDIPFFATWVLEQLVTWFLVHTAYNGSLIDLLCMLAFIYFCWEVARGLQHWIFFWLSSWSLG
jgi:hypothetical protein